METSDLMETQATTHVKNDHFSGGAQNGFLSPIFLFSMFHFVHSFTFGWPWLTFYEIAYEAKANREKDFLYFLTL